MRIPLKKSGLGLEFTILAYSCGFSNSSILLYTWFTICLWIPQTVPNFANSVSDSVNLSNMDHFWALQCFSYLFVEPKKRSKKSSNDANSDKNLILTGCGIRSQFTKRTVRPRKAVCYFRFLECWNFCLFASELFFNLFPRLFIQAADRMFQNYPSSIKQINGKAHLLEKPVLFRTNFGFYRLVIKAEISANIDFTRNKPLLNSINNLVLLS